MRAGAQKCASQNKIMAFIFIRVREEEGVRGDSMRVSEREKGWVKEKDSSRE